MSALRDLEDLLNSIHDKAIRDYMEEALSCYNSGAYRGCVVLSFTAAMDDIFAKLKVLKNNNRDAKKVYEDIKRRKNEQEVFEKSLLDQLKSNKIMNELDYGRLIQIRDMRNKCAHPSGHKSTPEEARFVFTELIDRVMSKERLLAKEYVDEIFSRLDNGNFFPTRTIGDIKNIVMEEIEKLHPQNFPYLVTGLADIFSAEKGNKKINARSFLSGLASIHGSGYIEESLVRYILNKKGDDDKFIDVVANILSCNPKLIGGCTVGGKKRIGKLMVKNVKNTDETLSLNSLKHPANLMASFLDSLDGEVFEDIFGDFAKETIDNWFYAIDPIVVSKLPKIKEYYLDKAFERAGSISFDKANEFAKKYPDLDEKFADKFSGKEALRLIASVVKAANNGAWSSEEIANAKFKSMPKTAEKAKEYLEKHPIKGKKIISGVGVPSDSFSEMYLD